MSEEFSVVEQICFLLLLPSRALSRTHVRTYAHKHFYGTHSCSHTHTLFYMHGNNFVCHVLLQQVIGCSAEYGGSARPTHTGYGKPCDVWSLGITTIEVAEGFPPHLVDKSPMAAMVRAYPNDFYCPCTICAIVNVIFQARRSLSKVLSRLTIALLRLSSSISLTASHTRHACVYSEADSCAHSYVCTNCSHP